eukprot:gene37164-60410_t
MIRAILSATILGGCLAVAMTASAQPAPRTADGRADLSGVWSNASLTWLERPASLKGRTLTEAEAKARAANDPMKKAAQRDALPSDPNAGPPPAGDGAL